MDKLIKLEAVKGVPKIIIELERVYGAYAIGKQIRTPHKAIRVITTEKCLELVHIDLIGPTQAESISGKKYIFVCIDDFSQYSWVYFLREKSEAFKAFKTFRAYRVYNKRTQSVIESVNVVIDDSPDESVETIVTDLVTELPLGELNTADNNSQPKSQESLDEDQESSEQETTLINDTGTIKYGLWYSKDSELSLVAYSDADWAGNIDGRKSTSGGCFFVGKNLVSSLIKKQNLISLSTAEAEYIAAGGCCTQLMWMKQMLLDYGLTQGIMTLYCDNVSAINISKNPVQHSRMKHIDTRHYYIRDLVKSKEIELEYIHTDKQLADILAKPLDSIQFEILRSALGICRID
ncbi:PREDICTED: uncharacterized protein LOC109165849 [Ipomoea nil]|uniref:uncharacterized protein LOC109165849 n=1 Tax=Ipomoea nil TaxID=35883 RepID=UPI0009010794|nr:PREDICTED: uncharacterized protein LOC109165849 [Ipomoea nil]